MGLSDYTLEQLQAILASSLQEGYFARADQVRAEIELRDPTGETSGLGADPTIIALAALTDTPGLLEQTGPDTFTKRPIGVGSSDAIPTRYDADNRYATTLALAAKEPAITGGTTSQFWRGDKTFQTLDKSAVGLGNADNTADASKPIFTSSVRGLAPSSGGGTSNYLRADGTWAAPPGSTSGTVTSVSVTTANGVSGSVSNPTTTPAISLTLGAITPSSIVASGTVTGSNLTGTNTGDQTITLTGNVTGSGTGSFATTIGSNQVTNAMLAQIATASFLGRTTASSGNVETLTATQATALLDSATTSVKGLLSSSDKTKLDGIATGATANSTDAYLLSRANHTGTQAGSTVTGAFTSSGMTMATSRFLGRTTASSGAVEELSASTAKTLLAISTSDVSGLATVATSGSATDLSAGTVPAARMPALTGDITTSAGAVATAIGSNKVTLGMMATVATATFHGRTTAGTGNVENLTASQATALLDTFGSAKGLVPGITSATNKYLQADATWVSAITPASLAASGTVTGSNLSGTNTGDQTITLTGDVTGSGASSFAATVANNAVTYAKMQDVSATARILGRKTAGAGDPEECSASEVLDFVGSTQGQIAYRGSSAWSALSPGTSGQKLKTQGAASNPIWVDDYAAITFVIDGGGSAITTGIKGDLSIPFGCTMIDWTILADQSGSIQFDLWKVAYASYPSTVTNTITASAKPLISSASKATSSTLTGWTTAVSAGDTIRINVDSATTIQRATLILKVSKT